MKIYKDYKDNQNYHVNKQMIGKQDLLLLKNKYIQLQILNQNHQIQNLN